MRDKRRRLLRQTKKWQHFFLSSFPFQERESRHEIFNAAELY